MTFCCRGEITERLSWLLCFSAMQFEVYADVTGVWRWRFVTRNGRTAVASPETFSTEAEAKRALERVRVALAEQIERMDD